MRFGTFDHIKQTGLIIKEDKTPISGHCVSGFDVSRIALLDKYSWQLVEEQVRKVEKIETAVQKDFQRLYVDAMTISHQSDVFTKEG